MKINNKRFSYKAAAALARIFFFIAIYGVLSLSMVQAQVPTPPPSSTALWRDLDPPTNPGNKDGHAMAYDSESRRVIIYGNHSGVETNETWTYNYSTNSWTNMNPATNPGAMAHIHMVYDSARDRVILHGTTGTWEYDYNMNRWTNRNPTTTPGGIGPATYGMAYDSESGRTIFFSTLTGETWAYNYSTNEWTNMNPPTPRPVADWRGMTNMVYLSRYDRTVLIDGINNRMWAYDYNTNRWEQRAIAPTRGPSVGGIYHMAYDSESDKILWYGDDQISWVYDWATDSWINTNASPSPLHHHANLVYVSTVDRIILYGGCRWPIPPCTGELYTWQFNYNASAPSPPDTTPPSAPTGLTVTAVSSSE